MEHLYPLSFLLLTAMPASAISVTGLMVQHSACGAPNGAIEIHVTGGSPPFTFLWSNGATTGNISGLLPGSYSVTVTDANNEEATGNWTIVNGPLDGGSWSAQDGHASCTGSLAGQVQVIEWGINGTPPYSYDPPPDGFDPQGDPYFVFQSMLPGSEVQIMVTDANGCTGTLTEYIVAPQLNGGPIMQVINIQGSCSNGAGGAATITNVNDGSFWTGPDWMLLDADNNYVMGSNGAANTMPFTGLAPGDYVFVRDWDPMGWYMAWPCDGNPYDRIGFTIPDLGTVCGQLNGRVFIDSDQDCAQDAGEAGVPYQVLEILPGPVHTITGSDGRYAIDLPDGAYTLGQTDPTLVQLCPASTPVPFTIATNPVTIDLADSSTVPLDLAVELASNA
ncbi:MAG: hypothetical protein KF797_14085, partial [Flavobacteriales bacterium]|nr:hypothetical protein [Flavobacteriales bacterium]